MPAAEDLPLAGDVVERVLRPFADLPGGADSLRLDTKVVSVTRDGFDKVRSAGREKAAFVVHAVAQGTAFDIKARAVIDATGTWRLPNPIGASGLPAMGEPACAEHIPTSSARSGSVMPASARFSSGRHSAANALPALAELAGTAPGARPVWSVRSRVLTRVFGGGDADALRARGALGTSLRQLRDSGRLEVAAGLRTMRVERSGDRLRYQGSTTRVGRRASQASTKSSAPRGNGRTSG